MTDTKGGLSRRRVLRSLVAVAAGSGCTAPTDGGRSDASATESSEATTNGDEMNAAPTTDATATAGAPTETAAGEMEAASDARADGERSLSGVRGAVYLPFRAFNAYRTWAEYDPDEAARDLGYAAELDLDAVRTLVSYEFWRADREAFRRRFEHFLSAAAARGLAVLPVLFESIGAQPTPENVASDGPVKSPRAAVLRRPARWGEPAEFVAWIAARYGDHPGLLALEIMNEPGTWTRRVNFVREMLRTAREAHASVPLTVGCKTAANNRQYRDPRPSVYQFHYNLPPTTEHMRAALREAAAVARRDGVPIWLTEWQRTLAAPPDRMRPNYASLATVIRGSDVDGDFFWQLMLNPAYNLPVRRRGRVNGLFTGDGGVYSAADARALAGGGDWSARETRPAWVEEFPRYGDSR